MYQFSSSESNRIDYKQGIHTFIKSSVQVFKFSRVTIKKTKGGGDIVGFCSPHTHTFKKHIMRRHG